MTIPDNLPDSVKKDMEDVQKFEEQRKGRRDSAAPVSTNEADSGQAVGKAVSSDAPTNPSEPKEEPATRAVESLEQTVKRLEQEKADLKRQLNSVSGNYGGTVQKLKSRIFDLQQQNEDMKKEMDRLAEEGAGKAGDPTESPVDPNMPPEGTSEHLKYVTDELVDKYGAEFFDAVSLVARGLDDKRFEELREKASEAETKVLDFETRQKTERFWRDVEKEAPNAYAVNGDAERGIPCAEGWGRYLDEPIAEGSLITRREEAERAMAALDASAFARLVNEFQKLKAQNSSSTPSQSGPAGQAVPQSSASPVHVDPNSGNGPIIPESEVIAFQNAKPDAYSIDEVNRLTAKYASAYREGRIQKGA